MPVVVSTSRWRRRLHAVGVDAGAREQRRGRLAQIVEAHRSRNRLRPQRAPARLRERLAGAVGALEAIRAVALLVVGAAFLVAAPAAHVLVALNQAGASERRAQDLLR